MTFQQFNLRPSVQRGVAALGFTVPTPVQQAAIPLLLEGNDAIVRAKTGSGKTLAFGLPILSMLERQPLPQALIVLPTRELAQQVCAAIASVENRLRCVPIYGGIRIEPQERALREGRDIVVGTPGRLKDLIMRGALNLSKVRILILDEADEMLDMGFRRDIDFLLERLPLRQQTLIFSATMPPDIEAIARKHMKNPSVVNLIQKEIIPSEIGHFFVRLNPDQRMESLLKVLKNEAPERALIFTRMKHETKNLAKKLENQAGIQAGFLNGNMSQNARDRMLERFRAGEFRYLVATDVAARGLDIDGVTHVFHYAIPPKVETYIHRSGRTGRAGKPGRAIAFVTPESEPDFRAIRRTIESTELR